MAYDDKIGPDFLREVPDFSGGLTPHHLCDGIETWLLQPRYALVEYIHEVIFHPSGRSSESHLSQQKRTEIDED
jgi:hypothetical protein